MYETTPGRLAKELGVSKFEMFQVMQELRINAKRMDALLSDSQESQLRRYFANKRRYREQRGKQQVLQRDLVPQVVPPVLREFPRTCSCCERRWVYRGERDEGLPTCPSCVEHVSTVGEGLERRLARAESHTALYRTDRDAAYRRAQENHELRQAAYESRAKWRAALAEVVLDHDEGPDGVCWCGHTMPCRSWLKLDEANRGIHRQVEKWSSWSDERLELFLYGDQRASSMLIDEDEPEDDRQEGAESTA